MIATAGLLGYAVLLLAAAPLLARARWPDRAPRLAVAAWLAVTGSALASLILAGMAPLLPAIRAGAGPARLLVGCLAALRAQCCTPARAAVAAGAALLALAVIARLTWCTLVTLTTASRARHRHRQGLSLAGRADRRLGAVIVGHGEPAAYCLPGRGQPIVVTQRSA